MRTHGNLKPRAAAGLVALAILTASQISIAQESDLRAFRLACSQDYKYYCTGDSPGVALEAACLRQYYINLSLQCRQQLDQQNAMATGEGQGSSSDDVSP